MKFLIIRANPRLNGATNALADAFVSGLDSIGATYTQFFLASKNVKDCLGCYACVSSKSRHCVHKDDFSDILKTLQASDILVVFSPLYFYTMSGLLKRFFERMFPYIKTTDFNGKKFLAITAASNRHGRIFEGLNKTYALIAEDLKFDFLAHIKRGEGVYITRPMAKSKQVSEVLEAMQFSAIELCRTQKISPETIEKIEQYLSDSDEAFEYNSQLYWQRLMSTNTDERKLSFDEILNALATSYLQQEKPQEIVIKFTLEDVNSSKLLQIKNNSAVILDNENLPENVSVKTNLKTLQGFLNGKVKVMEAIFTGNIRIGGDITIFTKFNRLFDLKAVAKKLS